MTSLKGRGSRKNMDTITTNEDTNESEDSMETEERLPQREYRTVITPEMADAFLQRNTNNRNPKPAQVQRISMALLLGEWMYNGEAIKFDWYGVLLDGQNRLLAIKATGVPAESLIVEGLPPESQETMDGIVPRRLSDILKWKGEKDPTSLAALINLVHIWDHNGLRNASAYRPTKGQALDLLNRHPEIREALRAGQAIARKVPVGVTLASACWFRFNLLDPDDNKDFWHAVTTGFHIPTDEQIAEAQANGEPAVGKASEPETGTYLVAAYLRRDKERREVPQWVKHAMIIKAWNLYRDGETRRHLSFKSGGQKSEKFPEPR